MSKNTKTRTAKRRERKRQRKLRTLVEEWRLSCAMIEAMDDQTIERQFQEARLEFIRGLGRMRAEERAYVDQEADGFASMRQQHLRRGMQDRFRWLAEGKVSMRRTLKGEPGRGCGWSPDCRRHHSRTLHGRRGDRQRGDVLVAKRRRQQRQEN